MFVQHCCTSQTELLPGLRRKLNKVNLEEKAKLACLAFELGQCAISDLPAGSAERVYHSFTQQFVRGDMNLMLELQSVLHELEASLSWRSISVLKELEKGVIKEAMHCENMMTSYSVAMGNQTIDFSHSPFVVFCPPMSSRTCTTLLPTRRFMNKHGPDILWKVLLKVMCHATCTYPIPLDV